MVTAAIAYDALPPEVQKQAEMILQAHPEAAKWKQQADKDKPADPSKYIFMRASTWPDEIRRGNSPYDHPGWHYVDYPLMPPNFPFVEGRDPQDNILFGINSCAKTIRDAGSNPEQRAAALSWLIHLIGDIHQPLHAAELVTAQFPLPEGDRGGNKIFVSVGGNPINLHAFWDRLPGNIFSPEYALSSAGRIERELPASALPDLTKDRDPVAWSLESRSIAIKDAYLDGKLPSTADSKELAQPLPPDYVARGKVICDQRLALGGYRLGAFMTALLTGETLPPASATPSPGATPTNAIVTESALAPGSTPETATKSSPEMRSAAEILSEAPGVFDKRQTTSGSTPKPSPPRAADRLVSDPTPSASRAP